MLLCVLLLLLFKPLLSLAMLLAADLQLLSAYSSFKGELSTLRLLPLLTS